MEFRVTTDLSKLPKSIDFNYEDLKAELDEKLEHYRTLVVTPDSIKGAKADRAALNKLMEAINDRRKDVKEKCLAGYTPFEEKCKELTGMINDARRSIDVQVKEYEEIDRDRKRALIEEAWKNLSCDLAEKISFSKVFNPKWLNKTASMGAVTLELSGRVEKIKADIEAIKSMALENEVPALARYYETLDLSAAIAEDARLKRVAKDEAKKSMPQESAVIQRTRVEFPHAEPVAPVAPVATVPAAADPVKEEPKTIKVIFYDTTAEFRAEMRALTQKYNIKYGGIK